MGKIFAKKWGIGLGISAALSIVVGLLNLFLCFFVKNPTSMIAYIVGGIVGAITGAITVGMYCFFLSKYIINKPDFKNQYDLDNQYWEKMIAQNKPIKFYKVWLALLPNLLFSVGFIILMCLYYNSLNSAIFSPELGQFGSMPFVGSAVLSACAAFWFIYWFGFNIHYLCATCPKCRNVMCKIYAGTKNYRDSSRTQSKTKTEYGTVGTVYLNKEKIGDIKGTTGRTTYTRNVKTSSWTTKCKCYYCGRNSKLQEGSSIHEDWKEE